MKSLELFCAKPLNISVCLQYFCYKSFRETPYDPNLISRYRKALDTAVKLATVYNVQPIRGRTVILCDVGRNMKIPCTAAKGLGKPRTVSFHAFTNNLFLVFQNSKYLFPLIYIKLYISTQHITVILEGPFFCVVYAAHPLSCIFPVMFTPLPFCALFRH